MECKCAMLFVFIFLQAAAQADATIPTLKHNAADRTPLRTHVPSKDMLNATFAVEIAAHQGLGEYGVDVERTRHALKDSLRLRAMHRLQDRLQKTKRVQVQGATGTLLTVIPNSPFCRKEFPNLELWAGNEGDRCRTTTEAIEKCRFDPNCQKTKLSPADARSGKGLPPQGWSCPDGCLYSGAKEPRCVKKGSREVCSVATSIRNACGSRPCLTVCKAPHPFLKSHPQRVSSNSRVDAASINMGDYCHGASQNWFPPLGCEMAYSNHKLLLDIGRTTGSEHSAESDDEDVMENDEEQGKNNESDAVSEGTKNALKDDLRLRAMHRLQDRLQKTKLVQVQGAASVDAGVTDSVGVWRRRRRTRRRRDRRRRDRRRRNAPGANGWAVFPWTWIKGKTGWTNGAVCHTDKEEVMSLLPGVAPDTTPRGMWRLVASNTHGASVEVQTGFTSGTSDSVSKTEKAHFSATMTATSTTKVTAYGSPGNGFASTKESSLAATAGGSSAIAVTAENSVQQSKKQMIKVECPDEQMTTEVTTGTNKFNKEVSASHSSLSTEFVYQWVVGNSIYEAKTQNFRCHRSPDGIERPPQCPPQFCGNPFTNPYCVNSARGQAGADHNCKR